MGEMEVSTKTKEFIQNKHVESDQMVIGWHVSVSQCLGMWVSDWYVWGVLYGIKLN